MKKNNLIFVALFVFILSTAIFSADRALVIGIDKYKHSNIPDIEGGIDDAIAMEILIQKKFGFKPNEIKRLIGQEATMQGIKDAVNYWLISQTNRGDRVFLFYSGHGARVADQDGDEEDQRDEVIAPYDVEVVDVGNKPQPKNFIRDDEVNEWLAKLSGRQIVMIFDSCNSGTLSRSINKKTKFINLETIEPPKTRGNGNEMSPKSKDLSIAIDSYMVNKMPNVVVFSAAQPNQTATWIDGQLCGGILPKAKNRGALACLIEKALVKGNPTISEIYNQIASEMKDLQESNLMEKNSSGEIQKPLFEYNPAMANKPLFGMVESVFVPNWEESALTALQNPLGKLEVSIKTEDNSTSYQIGDTIHYSVNLKQNAYVYVVVFSRNDVATVIFPFFNPKTNKQTENFLTAGVNNLPDGEAACPEGKDVWVTIASKKRISGLEDLSLGTTYTWQQVLDKIGTKDIQTNLETIARTRGVVPASTKLSAEDWQTATMTTYTLPNQKPCPKE